MPFFNHRAKEVMVRTWVEAADCVQNITMVAENVASMAKIFDPPGSGAQSRESSQPSLRGGSQDKDSCDKLDLDWDVEGNGWGDGGDDEREVVDQWSRRRRRFRNSSTSSRWASRNARDPPSLSDPSMETAPVASHDSTPVESAEDACVPTKKRSRECCDQGSRGSREKAARTEGPEDKIPPHQMHREA